MTGFFERGPGNRSMMRLLAFLGFALGSVVTIWGLILLTGVVKSVLSGVSEGVAVIGSLVMLIGAGLALAGGGEALKVVQHRNESKETIVSENGEVTTNEAVDMESSGSLGSDPTIRNGL